MPEAFATPEAGKAAARGAVINTHNFAPIPGTQFYLKPVGDLGKSGDPWTLILVGPEPDKGDVASQTGPRGEFFVNNVPPGKYFLIVWAPYNWIPVSSDPTDAQPMQFELKAGEIADFGSLTISWP